MQSEINRVQVEKWAIFSVFLALVGLQATIGILEFMIGGRWGLVILGVVRGLCLVFAVVALGVNMRNVSGLTKTSLEDCSILRKNQTREMKIMIKLNIFLTVLATIHTLYLGISGSKNYSLICLYTFLSVFQVSVFFLVTRGYISEERMEVWKFSRSGAQSQKYLPLDQFQYGHITKKSKPGEISRDQRFQHTAEVKNGKIVIQVRPISDVIIEDIECNSKDQLVSFDDQIDQYDRRSGHSIFLS
ncbi:unnamed protein product [Moneuplotes crassus]|uniref:Uncharacterized protein n=1 Tax=Euplotes crassus TaxID=5936 RepID=A0AAD1XUK4_EUPCR|nr:unnamed protein product [Moneuplotes crassus]